MEFVFLGPRHLSLAYGPGPGSQFVFPDPSLYFVFQGPVPSLKFVFRGHEHIFNPPLSCLSIT